MNKRDLFYFCAGNGGHELITAGNEIYPEKRTYPDDPQALFRPMPFFAEKIEEHSHSLVNALYGPSIIEEHNGQKYRMYYLKKCLKGDCVFEMSQDDILNYIAASDIIFPPKADGIKGRHATLNEIGMVEAKNVQLNGVLHELKFQTWVRTNDAFFYLPFELGSIEITIEPDWKLFE